MIFYANEGVLLVCSWDHGADLEVVLKNVAAAFKLLSKMKEGEFVKLQPENYVQLMACIAENVFFA